MSTLIVPPLNEDPWPSLGEGVSQWMEDSLAFGPGDLLGQPFRLDDEDRAIIERAGIAATVSPIPTSEFPTPARRPPYSVLANSKVEKALGRSMPAWQDALDRYLTAKGHRRT